MVSPSRNHIQERKSWLFSSPGQVQKLTMSVFSVGSGFVGSFSQSKGTHPQFCWDRSWWEWSLLFWQEDPATLKSYPWKREQVFSCKTHPLQLGRAWFPSCDIAPAWLCPKGHWNTSLLFPILQSRVLMKTGRSRVVLVLICLFVCLFSESWWLFLFQTRWSLVFRQG